MLEITKTQEVVIELMRSGVTGEPPVLPEGEIDWEAVVKEARQQAVGLMACDAAAAVADRIPAEIYAG